MRKFVILEIKKILLPFLLASSLSIVVNCIIAFLSRDSYVFYRNIEIWEQSNEVFDFIFAALASLPICWVVYFERKNNYIIYTLPRISKKKYILTKWFITALFGALIIFLISVVGLLISLYLFEPVTTVSFFNDNAELQHFAGYYFVHHPLLYGLILSAWRAFIGFLISTMGYVLALYEKNIFVVLTGPFIFTLLDSFILANIGIPEYNLFTSFEPASLVKESTTPSTFFVGILILIVSIIGLYLFYHVIRKEDIYQI